MARVPLWRGVPRFLPKEDLDSAGAGPGEDQPEPEPPKDYDPQPAKDPDDDGVDSPPGDDEAQESDFFGKGGLLAMDLAEAVMGAVRCGFNDTTGMFYVYRGGVWEPKVDPIEAEIGRLLGNRYRKSHKGNVLDLIRLSKTTLRITDEPRPDHINTPNGMVDWRTGDLLGHSPDYLSTVQLPVEYDVAADCPAFETFLTQVLPADCYMPTQDSPQGFIWELIGYAMYSGNPLHIAILLRGIGRNGKGTLIRLLKALLGARNTSAVGLHDLTGNRFRTATLYGRLANLAGDLDSKWINDTAAFKAITGGDTVQAEHKYGAPFDFTPWALPIYSANKPFGSADSSEGWHARWVVVPFPNNFLGCEDRTLDTKLQTDAELRGIMARGIRALPDLMDRGRLPQPTSVTEAKEAFIVASDAIRAWINECCRLHDDAPFIPRPLLYQAYRSYATSIDNSPKPLGSREFYNRLEQIKGITRCKKVVEGFKGIELLPPPSGGQP
ncbi:MAG: phage/plasmid primase, P4 family [Mycobacterium sp.]|uniref:DNA primase family protein n=1 Tax=Mycobacterium sp. TaxID=1785 RepID=UPI003BB692B2